VSRKLLPLKMPDPAKHVQLPPAEPGRRLLSSDMDQWVQHGRIADRSLTTSRARRERAAVGPATPRDHGGATALSLRSRMELLADVASQQPAAADDPAVVLPADAIGIEQWSRNLVRLIEQGGKAMAAYLKAREEDGLGGEPTGEIIDVVRTFGRVAESWLAHPRQAIAMQANLGQAYVDLWTSATKRMLGEPDKPVAGSDGQDRRFADPEWSSNAFFDLVRQAYLVTAQFTDRLVADAKGLDPHTRQKAGFYVRQLTDALSPTNFVPTNPELLRETIASQGENLVQGMRMLGEDIATGRGHLKIRQSDAAMFEVGRNLAVTPGKVLYQNDLMQLIQYAPATGTVLKRPVLIVPPWINKYYILDLTPERSFVKWCIDQGLTVFMISWVNPDATLAGNGFDDYMREGPLAALDVVAAATGEPQAHTLGYCAGGTLLAATLAYMAAKGDARALSATLLTTQVDFTHAGEIMTFVDEAQIETIEREMANTGYFEGRKMATAFNLLRSNDLVWPYVINNYLKGRTPRPFDLLYWNSDATRIPAANHSFYLRNCYLDNKLAKGEMVLTDETIDLGNITIPVYRLATREDHIAPAKSVFLGSKLFGGPVTFVVAGSGHIAGVINPPHQAKYSYWADGPAVSNVETWLGSADEHPGSWWPHWQRWIRDQDPTEVPARSPGGGKVAPIDDAPGSYVRVRE
jgi:polyhydroxyalkanoate synthase